MLDVTSETALQTAMFDIADEDVRRGWANADTYAIQPQARYQLIFSPPPSTVGHTVTMYQIVKPLPMFADFRIFGLPEQYSMHAIYFAASIYKTVEFRILRKRIVFFS